MGNLTSNIGTELAKITQGLRETMQAFKKRTEARMNARREDARPKEDAKQPEKKQPAPAK